MNLSRIYLIVILLLVLLAFGSGSNGQAIDPESNWYKEIDKSDDWYSRFDFSRYTKSDVENAKSKFLRIASNKTTDEWTGTYRRQTMLGSAAITWDEENGFVYTYIYHTLANIDFGDTKLTAHSVTFVSKKPTIRKLKPFFEGEYVQVSFGKRHLLVPKTRLVEFAIWSVGREVPSGRREKEIYTEEGFFWEKVGDEKKKIGDVPTFPPAFAHLIRRPIQSKILSVGKLRIKRETLKDWGTTSENHLRTLTLSAGRSQSVKVGMRFWIDELEEWVEIVAVTATRSRAELNRPFIDGREYRDRYENNDVTEFPCRDPKIGMSARTKVDYF